MSENDQTPNEKRETLKSQNKAYTLTEEEKDRLIKLKLNGAANAALAKEFGVTVNAIEYHWRRYIKNKAVELRLQPDLLRVQLVQRHLRMADDAAAAAVTARSNGNYKFAAAMMKQETYALGQIARICGFESITLNTNVEITPQMVQARIAELEAAKAELEPEIVEAEIVEDE